MKRTQSRRKNTRHHRIFLVYYATVGLFLVSLLTPESRVWGVNWWAYQSTAMQLVLIMVATFAGPIMWWWSKRAVTQELESKLENTTVGGYLVASATIVLVLTGAYIAFPATTHFLGDGYQLLGRLVGQAGTVKSWDIGASMVNDWVYSACNGTPDERALKTFRIVSVVAGLGALIVAALASAKLFESGPRRFIFLVGVSTAGYSLQFFGYVEHYGLFTASVIAFTLLGLLAALGKTSRVWAVSLFVVTCFFHIFGLALLPAALFLLLHDRAWFVKSTELPRKRKLILVSVGAVLGVATYLYLIQNYYFFKFAFLPIIPDRFTVDSDFLLSPKHVVDSLNLILLLVPGVFVFLTQLKGERRKGFFSEPPVRFLIILLISTFATIYIFNAGIGMPRNWDLFSLVGIPLAVLAYYSLFSGEKITRHDYFAASLVVVLGLTSLAPRVISQVVPETAITHFDNYVELDRTRNRNARMLLADYYESVGNHAAASRERTATQREFHESSYTNRGKQQLLAGDISQAERSFYKALEVNPIFVDAYANLATCCIRRNQLDSAMVFLEIANGLNPYNASAMNNIGTVRLRQGKLPEAADAYLEAIRIDSTAANAIAGLASVYVKMKNGIGATEYLEMLNRLTEMPAEYYLQAAKAAAENGLNSTARVAAGIAVTRGADRSAVRNLLTTYPELRR